MSNLKRNIFYQIVYEILVFILPLITSPYISRVLGANNLGVYSFSYSVAYYFQLMAMLGIKYYGTRSIASVRDNKTQINEVFSSVFALHAFVALIVIVFYFLYCFFIVREYRVIAIIQSLNVIAAFFDINWLFFGLEKFKITVSRNIVIKILTTCCIFIFVKDKDDLWKYTLIMSTGLAASQSVVWIFVSKYVKFTKVKISDIFVHLKPMVVLFIPIIAVSVLKYMDEIMLGILSTDSEVGYYDNAYKIVNIPSALIIAIGTVMLPRISNLMNNGLKEKSEQYAKLSYKYLMCLSIGMSFGLVAVSNTFSVVFWGEEFARCQPIIEMLSLAIPFTAYSNITRTQYLMPNSKDKIYMHSTIAGMMINFILNTFLVYKFKSVGVSISTFVSELVIMLYQIIAINKENNQWKYIKSFLWFYVPGIVMFLCIKSIFNNNPYNVFLLLLQILTGIFIYVSLSILILFLTRDELILKTITRFEKR